MTGTITQCESARVRHEGIARWAFLWRALVLGLGGALTLLLISTILLGIFAGWASAAVTGAGSVASGAAMSWVVGRRQEAVVEEQAAWDEVKAACGDTDAADDLRRRLGLITR
jgi:hypothetical protein